MSFLEKPIKPNISTEVEQIKKIQEEQINHLNEQIEAKKDLKDLLEKNLQKAKESST